MSLVRVRSSGRATPSPVPPGRRDGTERIPSPTEALDRSIFRSLSLERVVASSDCLIRPAFLERRWKPGQSGNPSGHAAEYGEVIKLARQFSVRAIERLGELMESEDERVAAVASNSILDRAYGRPETRKPEAADDLGARLAQMTKEQREQHAEQLAAQIRETVDRYKLIEGETVDVTPTDEADC
jgi:hypothetical protein